MSVEQWWTTGRLVPVTGRDGSALEVFVHDTGTGSSASAAPAATFLHGYPGSSYDWAWVIEAIRNVRTVAPDLLGFGASSKPRDHRWSIDEQTDLVQQVWDQLGVTRTVLVAHDYGTIVAQELLARAAPQVTGVLWLNGAVYPHLHRPTPVQEALLGPHGRELAAMITEASLGQSLPATFGTAAPATEDQVHQMWQAMSRDEGQQLSADLLDYIADRAEHGDRWVAAMESTALPMSFVWGEQDPVSGAHVLAEIRRRQPSATVRALPDVGHWPPLEAPAEITTAVLELLGTGETPVSEGSPA